MTEKTIASVTADFKNTEFKMQALENERAATVAKIEQLKGQLEHLRSQRDALEKIQQDAPSLLISGKMTDAEFSGNKKTLAELYTQIDDTDAMLVIYEKALDRDYVRQHSELSNKMHNLKKFLLLKFSENLAAEIASKHDKQIKQLAAVLQHNSQQGGFNYTVYYDLGQAIAAAAFGVFNGGPKIQQAEERNGLVKEAFQQMGI